MMTQVDERCEQKSKRAYTDPDPSRPMTVRVEWPERMYTSPTVSTLSGSGWRRSVWVHVYCSASNAELVETPYIAAHEMDGRVCSNVAKGGTFTGR